MTDERKPPRGVITIKEVSEILGPPRRTIWEAMRKRPDFPKPFKVGRSWHFVRAEVIAYREKLQAEFAEKHKPMTPEAQKEWDRIAAYGREYARQAMIGPRLPKRKK